MSINSSDEGYEKSMCLGVLFFSETLVASQEKIALNNFEFISFFSNKGHSSPNIR